MTIEKGQAWGTAAPLPPDGVIARSDADLRAVVESARRSGTPIPAIGLVGGDLCRTLGGTGDEGRLRSPAAVTFPIDVGSVLVDDAQHWFAAHLVARNRTWTRSWVAMNAQWFGPLNLAPRGHPDDGVLDIFEARLPAADLWKVRTRARWGAHLPHPGILGRRTDAVEVTFERPRRIWLDGEALGSVRRLSVRLEADAATVVI